MQYKGIREGIRRPLLGYVSLFFVFFFCEKGGVLKCKRILREYSASRAPVLESPITMVFGIWEIGPWF